MVEHTRTLGFRVAFAIGLGTMIAAGIFSLSGTAVAVVGSSAVISFVIAAVVAGITAAAYSEFASIYSENGGGYLFSSRTFEEREYLVYAIGASLFMGYTGTTAFYLATMDEWWFRFVIPHWIPLPHGSMAVLVAILLGALNARGTEESGTFQVIVTSAKVAVLLAFVGGAFAYKAPAETIGTFTGGFTTQPVPILTIASMAFITFFGFSAIAASAGEIIKPRKTVPRAIAASIITVTILYTFVIISMVNSPIPAEVIAQEGETAMGRVASAFLGPIGMNLIVAGAIFSMVSASNASVLAASGIGSLMGRQGHAPRRFSRIHREYNTPFWSVSTATATIVALIVLFIAVFPSEGPALFGLHLGLTALTGFATLNLLLPLSAVNLALIYSRRRYPDIDRPFTVPLVPAVPILGIAANLTLITNLPTKGVVVGVVIILGLLVAYAAWGGAPRIEELFERVVTAPPEPSSEGGTAVANGAETGDRYRILVPIARPERTVAHVKLAAALASSRGGNPLIQVLRVTEIPEQTPKEMVVEDAKAKTKEVEDALDGIDIEADYVVEGHICRNIAFDILQTARDDEADLILMGYPEEHHDVTETVELEAPCDVVFARGFTDTADVEIVNLGVGGGPHHLAALPMVNALAERGAEIHLINVHPEGGGMGEDPGKTLSRLSNTSTATVHNVSSATVAEGLVSVAAQNGGVLLIGASRTRRLRQWLFGSTPDRVIDLADGENLPVLVYASSVGVSGAIEDWLFPIYRYSRKRLGRERRQGDEVADSG